MKFFLNMVTFTNLIRFVGTRLSYRFI